ncbi:MAG: response regulator transcription factor [Bryobacterales bacterium]|nr:response regulator transcription factor [Bryobacterales bacterium]
MKETIRILLVEDQYFARLALHSVIDARDDMRIVAETASGSEALSLYLAQRPDLVLMDLRLPALSGFDAIRAIRNANPEARILVLSNYEGVADVERALALGALGYLTKDADADLLIEGIHRVWRGHRYLPPVLARRIEEGPDLDPLTARETQIVSLIAEGLSNKEIGERLGIAEKTVRVHMTHILDKMGAADRTQLLIIAVQRGMIHLD